MRTYPEALDYLYGLQRFGVRPGLDPMRRLLEALGNPHESLRFIHVAGTNGKGSVCAMLASIFRAANYRTGLYTSPHLVSFCERIQINGRQIPEADVVRLTGILRTASEQVEKESGAHPTFFEFVTALAAEYFREQKADIVIWETGLGGRLDATNVVTPLVSVITNIALDHADILGKTIGEIALEKCGIIKPGIPVVTSEPDPALVQLIAKHQVPSVPPLTRVQLQKESFQSENTKNVRLYLAKQEAEDSSGQLIHVWRNPVQKAGRIEYRSLRCPLVGIHQTLNAALAIAAVETALDFPQERFDPLSVDPDEVCEGLARTEWPARFQYLEPTDGRPALLLDGAHNPAATSTLCASLENHFRHRPMIFVLGILRDKDYTRICRMLAPFATGIYCANVKSPRTVASAELAAACHSGATSTDSGPALRNRAPEITDAGDLSRALELAFAAAKKLKDPVVVITGSLFLCGETLAYLKIPIFGKVATEEFKRSAQ